MVSFSTLSSYFSNPTPERTLKMQHAPLHAQRNTTVFSVWRVLMGALTLSAVGRVLGQVPGASADSVTAEAGDQWMHASRQKRSCDVLNVTIANPIPNQTALTNVLFNYTLDVNTWLSGSDLDGIVLEACLADGSPLPSWLNFSLTPMKLGSYSTLGCAHGVAVTNGVAYVADEGSGLQIINVSTPSTPIWLGSYSTPGNAYNVAVTNGVAYVADWASGLQIIDVSTPSAPLRLGNYTTPGCAVGVVVTNGVAYVAADSSGLQIINVSTPSAPIRLGSYATPGAAYNVAVANEVAYVAADSSGLQIINVSMSSAPIELGSYSTPGSAYGLTVTNGVVYVADYTSGLQIINVSTPSTPISLGSYATPGSASRVSVTNGVAYIADWTSGLQIIDVSALSTPELLGNYCTPGDAYDVAVINGVAYIAGSTSGLQIIDVSHWQLVGTPISADSGTLSITIRIKNSDPEVNNTFTLFVTAAPALSPTQSPAVLPTTAPTLSPTQSPSAWPTATPTLIPTQSPSTSPTTTPTLSPTQSPSALPTTAPTLLPTQSPHVRPTTVPTLIPTQSPSASPNTTPTLSPNKNPSASPTTLPTQSPTSPAGTPLQLSLSRFTLAQDSTQVLSPNNFMLLGGNVSLNQIQFTVCAVQHRQFELTTQPGLAINQFSYTALQLSQVQFVNDGNPPAFNITASNGVQTTPSQAAPILFLQNPTLVNAQIVLETGNSTSLLNVSSLATLNGNMNYTNTTTNTTCMTYTVVLAVNGYFFPINDSSVTLSTFTQAQVNQGQIGFADTGGESPPAVTLQAAPCNTTVPLATTFPVQFTVNGTYIPTLATNCLTIALGQTVQLSGQNLLACDPDLNVLPVFWIEDIQHGFFQNKNHPGIHITSFTQLNIDNGLIDFVQDGTFNAPCYTVSVGTGQILTPPLPASITFLEYPLPTLVTNVLRITQGEAVTLTANNLNATDATTSADCLIFSISNVQHGGFYLTSAPNREVVSFSGLQLLTGQVQFVDDGSGFVPGYDVSVVDAHGFAPPQVATVQFNLSPQHPMTPVPVTTTFSPQPTPGSLIDNKWFETGIGIVLSAFATLALWQFKKYRDDKSRRAENPMANGLKETLNLGDVRNFKAGTGKSFVESIEILNEALMAVGIRYEKMTETEKTQFILCLSVVLKQEGYVDDRNQQDSGCSRIVRHAYHTHLRGYRFHYDDLKQNTQDVAQKVKYQESEWEQKRWSVNPLHAQAQHGHPSSARSNPLYSDASQGNSATPDYSLSSIQSAAPANGHFAPAPQQLYANVTRTSGYVMNG